MPTPIVDFNLPTNSHTAEPRTLLRQADGDTPFIEQPIRMVSNVAHSDALDPMTLIGIIAVLVTVALMASLVPARRATRIEPTTALRIE
jgi:hypothetical protein